MNNLANEFVDGVGRLYAIAHVDTKGPSSKQVVVRQAQVLVCALKDSLKNGAAYKKTTSALSELKSLPISFMDKDDEQKAAVVIQKARRVLQGKELGKIVKPRPVNGMGF